MTARPRIPWDTTRFALADAIARRVADGAAVDATTREAVTALTTSADPDRAGQLTVRNGEPGPLVERLAVWALHHATDAAVEAAAAVLDGRSRAAAMVAAVDVEAEAGELVAC